MRAPTVQLHPECQGWASLALNGWFVTDVFCVSWFIVQLNRTFSFGSRGGVHFQLVDSGKGCGGREGCTPLLLFGPRSQMVAGVSWFW